MFIQLIVFIYPKWFKWVSGGKKHSTWFSPSLKIFGTHVKTLEANSCKGMIAGMSKLATRGGLGCRPTMTRERIKSSKNDPWSFLASLSTPGKREARQLHWRISKQTVQLSRCFPASKLGWKMWQPVRTWGFSVWCLWLSNVVWGVSGTVCRNRDISKSTRDLLSEEGSCPHLNMDLHSYTVS